MSVVSKALYKPLSIGTSVIGGLAAGAVFNQIWKRISSEPGKPEPQDLQRSTSEVLIAAALQGLVFGLVRAAVDRAGARGYEAMTHSDPN
ncbi:DUF4235 domain-containing protein [Rhodococcus triatomae]|uniref:DUF4235 domain-containing protein n=1 Tax=Rhodococcus triatomae TaxID=300028 RepID=A0A1G8H2L3_9NOCA|nr:DUF4235 domain-containing protein [Rhodococcus triatomae]QNG20226.1 DUF4235 domain-containing protein [Rhodococcus triatomae]QNG23859.1 DUF4235 domain-containing protein [Rhodococcus triatomae]SDI00888.1 Protein of unknown function [Rhodococcus triatomae]